MNIQQSSSPTLSLTWRQLLPTIVTIAAMICGFVSILVTFQAMQQGHENAELFRRAALLILVAMILDGIDGNLARWINGRSDFGAELDTYVDMTAFGIAPAVLIFALAMRSDIAPIWRAILPSAVAVSGMVRLAKFKVTDPFRGQAGYTGLPITANAGWVALFVFISQTPPTDRFSLREGWFAAVFLCGVIVFIILQVTNARYPKPTKKMMLFIPCVGLVITLVASYVIGLHKFSLVLSIFMIMIGISYAILGPLFIKGLEIHRNRKVSTTNHK